MSHAHIYSLQQPVELFQDFFSLLSPPKVISVQILSTSLLLSLFLSLYPTQRSIPVDYMMTTSTYDLLEEATF